MSETLKVHFAHILEKHTTGMKDVLSSVKSVYLMWTMGVSVKRVLYGSLDGQNTQLPTSVHGTF